MENEEAKEQTTQEKMSESSMESGQEDHQRYESGGEGECIQ